MCGQTPLPSVSQQQGHGMRRWRRRVLAAHSQRRSQPQRHTAQCQQHTMRVPVALTALPGRLALHHCAAQCYMAMESSGCAEERASIAHDAPHLDDHVVGLVHVELDLGAGIGMSQAQLRASHVTLLQALDKAAGRGEGRGGGECSRSGCRQQSVTSAPARLHHHPDPIAAARSRGKVLAHAAQHLAHLLVALARHARLLLRM